MDTVATLPTPAAPRSRKPARSQARKSNDRVKASLLLPRPLDIKLTAMAALQGTDRSTLASRILADATRDIVVGWRSRPAESSLPAEENRPDTSAA
jgi:hypothetical protein